MPETKGSDTNAASAPLLAGAALESEDSVRKPKRRKGQDDEGAKARPRYHHRDEDYILVTRDDLREIRGFGWLQQGLLSAGTFFFSGAFWLLAELLAHQEKFEFTAWMGMCLVSMSAGVALIVAALVFYSMRQKRLNKYFTDESGTL